MRMRRLDLIRYGHFTGRSLAFPVSEMDFHVVFGLNEAGKSTALSAIEDLLFGVPMLSPYNFLHDYSNMRIGAVLENDKGLLEVVRRKGSKDTLLGDSGLPVRGGESALRPFLGGADRAFYARMFSLDRVRLQAGGEEILKAKDEIGQILFSAGAGIAGLRDRLTELSDEAEDLWAAKKAKHRKYYQAETRLREAEGELRKQTLTASNWLVSKKAFESAEKAYATVECQLEEVSAELKKLGRIRRVYRYVSRKVELDKQLVDLKTAIPLSEDAKRLLEESEQSEFEASTRINVLSGQLATAREQLEALVYDERLVLRADDIGNLNDRRIEMRSAKADLPIREAELKAAEADLHALATELSWAAKNASELIKRIPARTQLSAVRALLGRHGAHISAVEQKTELLDDAEAECAALQKRLDTTDGPIDVSRLEAVINAVRASGDVNGRVRIAEQQVRNVQQRVDGLLASLDPGLSGEEEAKAIRVPPQSTIQCHRDKVQDWQRRNHMLSESVATAERDLENARNGFERVARDERVITTQAIQEARTNRDGLWTLVKQKHIENVPLSEDEASSHADVLDALGPAFESAMHTVDALADQRFDKAEAAGEQAALSRTIVEQEDHLAQLNEQQQVLIQEGENLNVDWQNLWAQAPFKPLPPDAMLKWLEVHAELLKAIDQRTDVAGELKVQRRQESECQESLLAELSSLETDRASFENERLPVILEYAESVRRHYEQQAEDKTRLKDSLQEAANNKERRRRELTRAQDTWLQWQQEWSTALTELKLEADSTPEAVSARFDIIEQMREKVASINDLQHQRIDKIKKGIAGFEAAAAKLVSELAEDLTSMAADDAVLEITRRLEVAQSILQQRKNKEKEIERFESEMHNSEEARQRALESVNHLKSEAGVDTNDELKIAIENSDTLRNLQAELAETLLTLQQEGDGLSVDYLETECSDIDIDHVTAREETTEAELKSLRAQLASKTEMRLEARAAFQSIDANDAAALAEASRQEALEDIRAVSERYVRVRTSATLLQWAIDRYRREKQAPLLKRAGELFSTITGDSFKDLQVDFDVNDNACLTGTRPNGDVVKVSGMSNGTADQLYLALRVASIEDYLDRAEALPFVADDLFVNFDDDRAKWGFEVLGKLSKKTQVLFFTHHLHLVKIAQAALGDSIFVVNLNEEQVGASA